MERAAVGLQLMVSMRGIHQLPISEISPARGKFFLCLFTFLGLCR
jgi:hypothetical protein